MTNKNQDRLEKEIHWLQGGMVFLTLLFLVLFWINQEGISNLETQLEEMQPECWEEEVYVEECAWVFAILNDTREWWWNEGEGRRCPEDCHKECKLIKTIKQICE